MSYSPWLRSPFTDLTACIINHQWQGPCRDMELKMMDCLEAYGLDLGARKCDTLIKDFQECSLKQKQRARYIAMKTERRRQYDAGERTKDNLYATPPRTDSY